MCGVPVPVHDDRIHSHRRHSVTYTKTIAVARHGGHLCIPTATLFCRDSRSSSANETRNDEKLPHSLAETFSLIHVPTVCHEIIMIRFVTAILVHCLRVQVSLSRCGVCLCAITYCTHRNHYNKLRRWIGKVRKRWKRRLTSR